MTTDHWLTLASRLFPSSPSLRLDLKQIRDCWFYLLLACTGIVVVGVVLEDEEHWFPAGKSRMDMARGIAMPSRWHKWKKRTALLGWVLLILGVGGELLFEAAVSNADGMLQDFNDTLLAITTEQASDAATSAKTAHGEADAVKKETDELT